MAEVIYFVKRVSTFFIEGIEPPRHLRVTVKCDTCREECYANKENWNNRNRRHDHKIICETCFRLGRHRTG